MAQGFGVLQFFSCKLHCWNGLTCKPFPPPLPAYRLPGLRPGALWQSVYHRADSPLAGVESRLGDRAQRAGRFYCLLGQLMGRQMSLCPPSWRGTCQMCCLRKKKNPPHISWCMPDLINAPPSVNRECGGKANTSATRAGYTDLAEENTGRRGRRNIFWFSLEERKR